MRRVSNFLRPSKNKKQAGRFAERSNEFLFFSVGAIALVAVVLEFQAVRFQGNAATLIFVFAVQIVIPGLVIWHLLDERRRRLRKLRSPHACPKCSYDNRESLDRCPECGTILPADHRRMSDIVESLDQLKQQLPPPELNKNESNKSESD